MKADVVVVGGGPSGAVCARELALLGYSVVLIERAKMPRSKVCGEYLNCGSLKHIEELGLLQGLLQEAHLLKGLCLRTAERSLHLDFPKAAMALERRIFDAALLGSACASGVQLLDARVHDLRFREGEVCGVKYEGAEIAGDLEARYTVGADGCGSVVARRLGLTVRIPRKVRFAIGGHFEAKSSDRLEMHVERGTYVASNPLNGNRANVMLIAPKLAFSASGQGSDEWFRKTVDSLMPHPAFDIERRLGSRVAFGPLSHTVTCAASRNVLLVGDAAGFISPFTGQGVCIALSSARSAAAALHATLAKPDSKKREFLMYDRLQRGDRYARSGLSSLLEMLAHAPFLAHRVMRRIEADDGVRESLLNLFCGLARPNLVHGIRLLSGMVV